MPHDALKSGLLRWSPCLRRCQFSPGISTSVSTLLRLVVVRHRLVWQGEVLFLIEAHQVENVEVGDHELEQVAVSGTT